MPSAVRAIAASDGAVWVALDGGGVRELDPSRNRLAGTTIDLPDQDALLSTRPGQIWAVRVDGGTAALTRIDLTTAQ
jgi:streptogramin lyase